MIVEDVMHSGISNNKKLDVNSLKIIRNDSFSANETGDYRPLRNTYAFHQTQMTAALSKSQQKQDDLSAPNGAGRLFGRRPLAPHAPAAHPACVRTRPVVQRLAGGGAIGHVLAAVRVALQVRLDGRPDDRRLRNGV